MGFIDFFQNNRNTIIIVLSIIIFYYTYLLYHNSCIYADLMSGFWCADSEFLQDAGLSSFLIYFAQASRGVRACYILAEQKGELIINEPCTAAISQTWKLSNWGIGLGVKTYSIKFTDLETDDIPKTQTLNFFPKTGKLIMTNNDVVYGVFYKDSKLTDTMYVTDKIKPEENDCKESAETPDDNSE